MNYFIIGDIHGCYYTMLKMLEFRNPNENLVILGDIIHKGKHSFKTLNYLMNLQKNQPAEILVLKGNNEYLFEQYYRRNFSIYAQKMFKKYNLDYNKTLDWLHLLPHYMESTHIFISHAGVDIDNTNDLEIDELSVIFTKKKLRDVQKVQFLGHLVYDEPYLDKDANAWYIDTGAGFGKKLTGAKVNEEGEILEFISLELDERDAFEDD